MLQEDLDEAYAGKVQLLSVNARGHEGGVVQMDQYARLPLLQDTEIDDAWGVWNAGYRDVVIVDGQGRIVGVYNLSGHTLSNEDNYADLRDMIVAELPP